MIIISPDGLIIRYFSNSIVEMVEIAGDWPFHRKDSRLLRSLTQQRTRAFDVIASGNALIGISTTMLYTYSPFCGRGGRLGGTGVEEKKAVISVLGQPLICLA